MFHAIIKLLKKIFTKKMDIQQFEEQYKNKSFQWIKGDHFGKVEKYKSVAVDGNLKFIEFASGRRINYNLLKEFMEVGDVPLKDLTPTVKNIPLDEDFATETITNPTPQPITREVQSKQAVFTTIQKVEVEKNPIDLILDKQKPNEVELEIKLKLNLPSKELYDIMNGSFENVDENIVNWIFKNLNQEEVKESIKNGILDFYFEEDENEKNKSLKAPRRRFK